MKLTVWITLFFIFLTLSIFILTNAQDTNNIEHNENEEEYEHDAEFPSDFDFDAYHDAILNNNADGTDPTPATEATSTPPPTPPPTPTTPTPITPPSPPAPPRSVRFIRDFVPAKCPISVKHNYFVTFSYTSHYITPDNKVGEKFDETPQYGSITLQANRRHMLPALYRGLIGACFDEKRTVIIPWEVANLKDTSLKEKTDFVFIVHIIDISPFTDYFDEMDVNFDGCITADEFKAYITEEHKTAPHLVEAAVTKLMASNDKDKDGYVECGEFNSGNKNCNNITCLPVMRRRLEEERRRKAEEERRIAAEKAEAERKLAAERAEAERIAAEKAEEERLLRLKEAEELAARLKEEELARIREELLRLKEAEELAARLKEEELRRDTEAAVAAAIAASAANTTPDVPADPSTTAPPTTTPTTTTETGTITL